MSSFENNVAFAPGFEIAPTKNPIGFVYGEDVKHGKPDPEVYYKMLNKYYWINNDNIHIYEDSDVGILAAVKSGINLNNLIIIDEFYETY